MMSASLSVPVDVFEQYVLRCRIFHGVVPCYTGRILFAMAMAITKGRCTLLTPQQALGSALHASEQTLVQTQIDAIACLGVSGTYMSHATSTAHIPSSLSVRSRMSTIHSTCGPDSVRAHVVPSTYHSDHMLVSAT